MIMRYMDKDRAVALLHPPGFLYPCGFSTVWKNWDMVWNSYAHTINYNIIVTTTRCDDDVINERVRRVR